MKLFSTTCKLQDQFLIKIRYFEQLLRFCFSGTQDLLCSRHNILEFLVILGFYWDIQYAFSIESKEKAALEEEDCWIYALIGVSPPKPLVEKSIEDMVLVSSFEIML